MYPGPGATVGLAGKPRPVTMGGQGKGRGSVRCAPEVVAPAGARGHSSRKGGAAVSLMVYTSWRGPGGGAAGSWSGSGRTEGGAPHVWTTVAMAPGQGAGGPRAGGDSRASRAGGLEEQGKKRSAYDWCLVVG